MKTPIRLLMMAMIASTLVLAGCSYQPARIHSKPLIEIEGGHGHRDYRGDDRRYREHDRYQKRHHDRYQKRHHHRAERGYSPGYRQNRDYRESRGYRDYLGQRENRGQGRFCPPGLRMQGRC